jgi:hypothetical protein
MAAASELGKIAAKAGEQCYAGKTWIGYCQGSPNSFSFYAAADCSSAGTGPNLWCAL